MTVTFSTRTGVPTWSADSDTFTRLQVDQGFASIDLLMAVTGEGPLGGRPGFGPGGQFYLATDQGVLYYDTGTAWVVAGRVVIGTQVLMPAALQTASLTEWRSATGTVLGKVDVNGALYVDKVRFATPALGNFVPVSAINGLTNSSPGVVAAFGYRLTADGWCEILGILATNGASAVPISAPAAFPAPADGVIHAFMVATGPPGGVTPTNVELNGTGQLLGGVMDTTLGGYLSLGNIRYYVGG